LTLTQRRQHLAFDSENNYPLSGSGRDTHLSNGLTHDGGWQETLSLEFVAKAGCPSHPSLPIRPPNGLNCYAFQTNNNES